MYVTQNMALTVEKASQEQYKSRVWFKYRAGRITASKMKAVYHTNPANPAQSLIKQICYPQMYDFTSIQTSWGCTHEKAARDRYEKRMKETHSAFQVTDSGLVINPQWPFIGATPLMAWYRVPAVVRELWKSSAHTVIKVKVLKLRLRIKNFAFKKMQMVCLNWNPPMHTIIKYRHNYSFVMLPTVTFVYVHSLKMKSMIFIKNVYPKTLNCGKNVSRNPNIFLKHLFFLS